MVLYGRNCLRKKKKMKKQQRGAAIHGGDVRMSLLGPATQQPQPYLQRQTGASAAFWARGEY